MAIGILTRCEVLSTDDATKLSDTMVSSQVEIHESVSPKRSILAPKKRCRISVASSEPEAASAIAKALSHYAAARHVRHERKAHARLTSLKFAPRTNRVNWSALLRRGGGEGVGTIFLNVMINFTYCQFW